MPDWLEPFLVATPHMAWFFAGIGIPWALVLLPRQDWRDWPTVAGTGLALGPVLGTTWLFILGTFGQFSWLAAFSGTLTLSLVGMGLAWQRRYEDIGDAPPDNGPRFWGLTLALLVMMAIGWLANIWDTAFWPFLRYDTLWTFGYNAKIFMMEERIPDHISYYPQLVPLTFTYGGLAWGAFNDHAARAAVPWFMLSSTFAAYLLGWRVYRRQLTGILTAALWLLLPSSLVWSSSGDLEHPMALYFTLATVFFVLAWRHENWRYAILAGLMAGAAMWTKPTAGAFALGVLLVISLTGLYAYQHNQRDWFRNKFQIAFIIGLTTLPIGSMWYIRNLLLGHSWTDLPPPYWQDSAQRSGMQLHWLWFFAGLVVAYLMLQAWRHDLRRAMWPVLAFVLMSVAILPTALSVPDDGWTWQTSWGWINGFREPSRRLNAIEGSLLLLGVGLLIWSGRVTWRRQQREDQQALLLTWGIGLPFFTVYFWSFSYHYRLALTIMPLILAPIAAVIVAWVIPFILENHARRYATITVAVLLSLIAPVAATYHTALNTLNDTGIDTDREKYAYANPALLQTVTILENYAQTQPLTVLIPGENRLHFFFPTWSIDDRSLPTDVTDLQGYDLFVAYTATDFLWRIYALVPNQVMAWTELAWIYPLPQNGHEWALDGPFDTPLPRVLKPIFTPIDDGKDRYEVFAVNVDSAYQTIEPQTALDRVVFGSTLQLLGYDLPTTTFQQGQSYTLKFYWRGAEDGPPQADYSIFIHIIDPTTDEVVAQLDSGLMDGLFPTRMLTPGMILQDRRVWSIGSDLQSGPILIRIGVYEPPAGPRLPLMIGDSPAGDGYVFEETIVVE